MRQVFFKKKKTFKKKIKIKIIRNQQMNYPRIWTYPTGVETRTQKRLTHQ